MEDCPGCGAVGMGVPMGLLTVPSHVLVIDEPSGTVFAVCDACHDWRPLPEVTPASLLAHGTAERALSGDARVVICMGSPETQGETGRGLTMIALAPESTRAGTGGMEIAVAVAALLVILVLVGQNQRLASLAGVSAHLAGALMALLAIMCAARAGVSRNRTVWRSPWVIGLLALGAGITLLDFLSPIALTMYWLGLLLGTLMPFVPTQLAARPGQVRPRRVSRIAAESVAIRGDPEHAESWEVTCQGLLARRVVATGTRPETLADFLTVLRYRTDDATRMQGAMLARRLGGIRGVFQALGMADGTRWTPLSVLPPVAIAALAAGIEDLIQHDAWRTHSQNAEAGRRRLAALQELMIDAPEGKG